MGASTGAWVLGFWYSSLSRWLCRLLWPQPRGWISWLPCQSTYAFSYSGATTVRQYQIPLCSQELRCSLRSRVILWDPFCPLPYVGTREARLHLSCPPLNHRAAELSELLKITSVLYAAKVASPSLGGCVWSHSPGDPMVKVDTIL